MIISSAIDRTNANDGVEPATSLLWLQYYLAQHYDYLGDITKAFEYIDQAICDTPTLVELYMFKAKISKVRLNVNEWRISTVLSWKHAGDFQTAATWMDEAQSLDTADRFINCKCTKYLLRANDTHRALEMAGKFTRVSRFEMKTRRSFVSAGKFIARRIPSRNAVHVVRIGNGSRVSSNEEVRRSSEEMPRNRSSKTRVCRTFCVSRCRFVAFSRVHRRSIRFSFVLSSQNGAMCLCGHAQSGRSHERSPILPSSSANCCRSKPFILHSLSPTSSRCSVRFTSVFTIIRCPTKITKRTINWVKSQRTRAENNTHLNRFLANMSASEAKKYRSKMRKQQMREEQEKQKQLEAERRKKEFQRSRNKEDAEEDKMKEEEIVAEKLERVIAIDFSLHLHPSRFSAKKPLEEAMRFLQPLEDFSGNFFDTHFLGFEVYYRRRKSNSREDVHPLLCRLGKFLLMLRCLKRMAKLDATHGKFHSCLMKFVKLVETETIADERIRSLIDEELKTFGFQKGDANKQIEESNKKFIEKNLSSLPHRVEGKIELKRAVPPLTSLSLSFFKRPKWCCCWTPRATWKRSNSSPLSIEISSISIWK